MTAPIGKAVSILRQQGLVELLRRARRRVARRFEARHSALTVSHKAAMRWFEHRRDEYARLIGAAAPYIAEDAVVFDVGANIGFFTLLLVERLGFRGRAYLFEPIAHLAELCEQTFRDSAVDVTVLPFGLSDTDAEEDIFVADNGNLGWNTLIPPRAPSNRTKTRIQLKPLDRCGIQATPSFIKIDVEGSEYRVLAGMRSAFGQWHPLPAILCEVGWGRSHPEWQKELSVFGDLERMGYRICDLDGLPVNLRTLRRTTDVLLVPADARP